MYVGLVLGLAALSAYLANVASFALVPCFVAGSERSRGPDRGEGFMAHEIVALSEDRA